ncbi:hypothetical protein L1987_49827 [Smallanthus sonchifolius]|uniref:Uncharacterized protein n=1 Tax=Smallanthus sonchifolius TaxID=185202 RepID=A0ACB9FWU1_9ASTR|nr:hypothetical protein L1987_49827 [Smallanthus sonchifolius]
MCTKTSQNFSYSLFNAGCHCNLQESDEVEVTQHHLVVAHGNRSYQPLHSFNPPTGTPEERSQIENVQEEFTRNKLNVKHSSDLLMRFQFARRNRSEIEKSQANHDDEVVVKTLKKGLKLYSTLQGEEGSWPADYGGPLFLLSGLIVGLHVMGAKDAVLSREHKRKIRRYLYNHQNVDGRWGLHIEGHSTMFCTALKPEVAWRKNGWW